MTPKQSSTSDPSRGRYDLYDQLDRLEELLEDMMALGVRSIEDVEGRILELDQQIESLENDSD